MIHTRLHFLHSPSVKIQLKTAQQVGIPIPNKSKFNLSSVAAPHSFLPTEHWYHDYSIKFSTELYCKLKPVTSLHLRGYAQWNYSYYTTRKQEEKPFNCDNQRCHRQSRDFFFYVCVENHYVLQHIKWYRVISSLQRDTQFAQCTLISRNSCSWGVLLLHSIFPYTFLVSSACIRHFLVKNSMWLSAWHSTIIRKVASPQFLRKEMQASQMTIVVWQKDSPSMAL